MKKILVIGGSGRLGRETVGILRAEGRDVTVFSRSAKPSAGVAAAQGSVTQPPQIAAAVWGMDAVVVILESDEDEKSPNGPTAVHHQGVLNILKALKETSTRVVLITQIYIDRKSEHPEIADIIEARKKGEEALRKSGLPYAILRPGWLTSAPERGEVLHLEQGDKSDGRVSRSGVARVIAEALKSGEALSTTFEIYERPGSEAPLRDLLAGLRKD